MGKGKQVRMCAQESSTGYAVSTAGQTTMTVLFSSYAGLRTCVYAYNASSTAAAAFTGTFRDSSGANLLWSFTLGTSSTAASAATYMAVTPPAFLFRTAAGTNMTLNVSSSNAGMSVSIAAFRAP